MCVDRIVEVGCRARRAGCRLGRKRTSGIGVDRIVEVGSWARRAGWKLGGG
jgi:hypothetical protein